MAETRFVNEELPDELLSYFTVHDGSVRWVEKPPADNKTFRARRAPWGCEAGGRLIHGRGKLITFARCALVSSDLRFALERGEWPWQVGGAVTYEPGAGDADALASVRQRWQLREGALTWRMDRGYTATGEPQYRAGDPVTGFALSGFRGRLISTGGFGFIRSDVVHALQHGEWPWQTVNYWD